MVCNIVLLVVHVSTLAQTQLFDLGIDLIGNYLNLLKIKNDHIESVRLSQNTSMFLLCTTNITYMTMKTEYPIQKSQPSERMEQKLKFISYPYYADGSRKVGHKTYKAINWSIR